MNKDEPGAVATILVVDDDALIAMNTVDMLAEQGHRVLEAYSGQQALDVIGSGERVDAIITDYSMPGMTGIELARRAREILPGVAVLLATGYADLPEDGADAFPRLSKPFEESRLLAVVREALATNGAAPTR